MGRCGRGGLESAARRPKRTRSRGPTLGSGCSTAVHLASSLAQEEVDITAAMAVGSVLMPQAGLRSCPGAEDSNQPGGWLEVVQRFTVKAYLLIAFLSNHKVFTFMPGANFSPGTQPPDSQASRSPLGNSSPQRFHCLESPSHPHGQDRLHCFLGNSTQDCLPLRRHLEHLFHLSHDHFAPNSNLFCTYKLSLAS